MPLNYYLEPEWKASFTILYISKKQNNIMIIVNIHDE